MVPTSYGVIGFVILDRYERRDKSLGQPSSVHTQSRFATEVSQAGMPRNPILPGFANFVNLLVLRDQLIGEFQDHRFSQDREQELPRLKDLIIN